MNDPLGITAYLDGSSQRALYDGARSVEFLYASATTPIAAYASLPAPLYKPGPRTMPAAQLSYSGSSSTSQFGASEDSFTGRRPYGLRSRMDDPSKESLFFKQQIERDRENAKAAQLMNN
jgi:hypothetical protein